MAQVVSSEGDSSSDSRVSLGDRDKDFEPSAEMMVHDYDDEQTLEEEEALSENESLDELDDLEKEGDMPLEELLARYSGAPPLPPEELENERYMSEEEKEDEECPDPQSESLEETPSQTARLLRSSNAPGESEDDSEDEDYQPEKDPSWQKTISVGSQYQAVVPEGLHPYGDAPAYENEDRLLWDPSKLNGEKVDRYVLEVRRQQSQAAANALPNGTQCCDDEQALYLLLQCGLNTEEALRRRKMQAITPTEPMSLWSEEECQNFENGLRLFGKDFYTIQHNKVRTRSVGELVQFYYLWKKTERHDVFANKTRLDKKKYALHPGITDYMDRFVDEQESPTSRDRSASPVHSLLYCDPKRQHSSSHTSPHSETDKVVMQLSPAKNNTSPCSSHYSYDCPPPSKRIKTTSPAPVTTLENTVVTMSSHISQSTEPSSIVLS